MKDELILLINGRTHQGWNSVSITRSIEQGTHRFNVSLTEQAQSVNQPHLIQPGAACQLYAGEELVTSGYIDDIERSYDSTQHSASISGRSKLADLVDCSSTGKQQTKGRSLKDVATTLCQPFGIDVKVDPSATEATKILSKDSTLDNGQPIWEFLEQLARQTGVLLISDADGNLLITRTRTQETDTAINLGTNVTSASGSFSHRDLFSEYIVTGQHPNINGQDARDNQSRGSFKTGRGRYRPTVISADNPVDNEECKRLAQWHNNVRRGRSETITYTLSGWRQTATGRLWTPNELINVNDAVLGLKDTRLLITEVTFSANNQGTTTRLKLMSPKAFLLPETGKTPVVSQPAPAADPHSGAAFDEAGYFI